MRLLLSEALPLRTTRMLGDFAQDAVLPHRYGDLTSGRFNLIRLDDSTFFAADHPMPIAQVFVDGQETKGWQQATRSDLFGNTWTVVVLAAPAPAGASLSATGKGKRNPKTGALIENPADIIEDVLRLAGRGELTFDALRAECAAADLRLAGSVDSALTIRATIDSILASAGAIWTPQMARLYPTQTIIGPIKTLDRLRASNIKVSASLKNTADILRLAYDPDAASSSSQHYIELSANPMRFGSYVVDRTGTPVFRGLSRDLTLAWLRTPGNAESVARRVLPWLAGEKYDVTFESLDITVRPGQWVVLEDNPEWPLPGPDPTVMVLSAEVTPGAKHVLCTGEALISSPSVSVTGHSIALPTTRDASVELAVKDGVATMIVRDKNGKPVLDARVNIDGGPSKKTDAQGSVSFPATKGPHVMAVQAPGKQAELVDIIV